jgi:hypothetical protein
VLEQTHLIVELKFNPVAPTSLVKALSRVCKVESEKVGWVMFVFDCRPCALPICGAQL